MLRETLNHLIWLASAWLRRFYDEATERPFGLFYDPVGQGERVRLVRWWRFFLRLAAMTCLVSAAAFGSVGNPRPLKRTIDPVVVLGQSTPTLSGKKIAQLGLFAVGPGGLVPIPFQIDERRDGDYVYTAGSVASVDTDRGALDADDEIAFIAGDAGPRLEPFALPTGAQAGVEIAVTDPIDGGTSYVYLLAYPTAAPRSRTDYVRYHVRENIIETSDYLIGYDPEAPISIGRLQVRKPGGQLGWSVADRQKIRIEADLFWNVAHISRHEGDFQCRVAGYIDGPVRVIRQTKNWQLLFWNIPTPSVRLTSTYWKTGMVFPMTVNLPFDVTRFFRRVQMRIYVDGPTNVPGRRYYNDHNRGGVDVDGRMSPAEQQMDHRPFHWQVVAGTLPQHSEGWFSRQTYDRQAVPIDLPLYYVDDVNFENGPERYRGCFGCAGFEFDGLSQLQSGKFNLTVQMYPMQSYRPGDETTFLNITDRPLKTYATALPVQ